MDVHPGSRYREEHCYTLHLKEKKEVMPCCEAPGI
jgi:hypothetical protein